jgi:hypothetical protein
MAKAKRSRRTYRTVRRRGASRGPKNIPILPVAGVAIAVAQPILYGLNLGGDAKTISTNIANGFSVNFLAYDFNAKQLTTVGLLNGYAPPIIGIVGHKVMNFLGVNKVLARAKMGFVL